MAGNCICGVIIMYKQVKEKNVVLNYVQRLSDNAVIPFDELNTDYKEYLEWLAEGNEPLPADE
jgi:hypothetical protein